MGREVLKEIRRTRRTDLLPILDFICGHDSTGVDGIQLVMIKVLSERMRADEKNELVNKYERTIANIELLLTSKASEVEEQLIRIHFAAVSAAIKQANDATESERGKRRNTIHKYKRQSWPSWLRLGEKARYDR